MIGNPLFAGSRANLITSRHQIALKLGCLLVLTLVFGLFAGSAQAQDFGYVSLDRVDGQYETGPHAGKLRAGEVTFHIRFTTPATNTHNQNISNGWRVYSSDGATWSPAQIGPVPGLLEAQFTNLFDYEWDAPTVDSLGIVGIAFPPQVGLPPGYDEVVFEIKTTIDPSSDGMTTGNGPGPPADRYSSRPGMGLIVSRL